MQNASIMTKNRAFVGGFVNFREFFESGGPLDSPTGDGPTDPGPKKGTDRDWGAAGGWARFPRTDQWAHSL